MGQGRGHKFKGVPKNPQNSVTKRNNILMQHFRETKFMLKIHNACNSNILE